MNMLLFISLFIQTVFSLTSPNEKVAASVEMAEGRPVLQVSCNKQKVLEHISLGITVEGADFHEKLSVAGVSESQHIKEHYTALHGKRSSCFNEANAATVTFANAEGRQMDVQLRAYNDGLCFVTSSTIRSVGNSDSLASIPPMSLPTMPHAGCRNS